MRVGLSSLRTGRRVRLITGKSAPAHRENGIAMLRGIRSPQLTTHHNAEWDAVSLRIGAGNSGQPHPALHRARSPTFAGGRCVPLGISLATVGNEGCNSWRIGLWPSSFSEPPPSNVRAPGSITQAERPAQQGGAFLFSGLYHSGAVVYCADHAARDLPALRARNSANSCSSV